MRDHLEFILNGDVRRLDSVDPTATLLNYLRDNQGLTGTKEGCAEGDCGACTVTVSQKTSDREIEHRAVNACICLLPMLDGKAVTTVEALQGKAGQPHNVQKAMVDLHASQCGFCTPGIVMSLHAAGLNADRLDGKTAPDILAGNLCRCTGYGPILKAAEALGRKDADASSRPDLSALVGLGDKNFVTGEGDGRRFYIPTSLDQLDTLCADHPDAVLVAGATDVGLWVTKAHRQLETVIYLNQISELKVIRTDGDTLWIGAGATYEEAMPVLTRHWPDLGELVRRLGSKQVRNTGTIGGNIANGSPIGDMPPALIALGAKLHLRGDKGQRTLELEDYFIDYGQQDRAPGEYVEGIEIPLPDIADRLRCYKLSKRFDVDITAVLGCFDIAVRDGQITSARIAYGGMAGIPKRASLVEKALTGQPWTEATIRAAMQEYKHDFSPLSDMRASEEYRAKAAQNLLLKYFLEMQADRSQTRLVGLGADLL
jgi:xanthine dehydrogenase small subunit